MSSEIVYDKYWMNDYLNRLRRERDLVNEIIESLNAVRFGADAAQLAVILQILQELYDEKHTLVRVIKSLEEYQSFADYAAWSLQNVVQNLDIPD